MKNRTLAATFVLFWLVGVPPCALAQDGATADEPASDGAEAPAVGSDDEEPAGESAEGPADESDSEGDSDEADDSNEADDSGEDGSEGDSGEDEPAEDDSEDEPRTAYVLERIEIRGNTSTDAAVIRPYVTARVGEPLEPDDPRIEAIRWRLLGTGWFDEVQLSLERGSERGQVVLVVEVSERNTFIVQGLTLGFSEGLNSTLAVDTQPEPYLGISVAELNLFGTGVSLEATALLSVPQQGVRLSAGQGAVDGGDWGLTGTAFFSNAREFFGNDDVVIARDECPIGEMGCEEARNAIVDYLRFGASLGTGVDIAPTVRFTLDYQFDAIEVIDRPEAASHVRGTEILPIDFHILDGWSFISRLVLGLSHDERDNPGLATEGRHLFLTLDLSSQLIGSSYDFVRVQGGWREWIRLPEAHHTLRFGLFFGAAVGDTPFFDRFYAADLSDLIPSRVMGLNLDRRAPPNLLGTAVGEMRAQELAARFDIEYSVWLWESRDDVRGLILYGLVGVYGLMDREDLAIAIPGYAGASRAPLDLTFDVGLRLDTVVGVFALGFSTLLGFIQL